MKGETGERTARKEVDVEVIPPLRCVGIRQPRNWVEHSMIQNQGIETSKLVQTLANSAVSDLCERVSIYPLHSFILSSTALLSLLPPSSISSGLAFQGSTYTQIRQIRGNILNLPRVCILQLLQWTCRASNSEDFVNWVALEEEVCDGESDAAGAAGQ